MGKKPEKIFAASLRALAAWFERQKRVLPWRDQPSVYRVWISEIMLQQTQVATVIPYFERFVARFPDVETLARAREEDVLLHWAGLGYYSRARNLHRAAQAIVARGRFPASRAEWLEMPGVGDYTAGAILSISGNVIEAILDGNVERVLSRVRMVTRARGDAAYKARLWRLSRAFVERGHEQGVAPSVLNQALMELGATVCSPKKPKCGVCPLAGTPGAAGAGLCRAHARLPGEEDAFPPRKKRKEWLEVREELHCVLDPSGLVLLRKRAKGEWRQGLWDLLDQKPELAVEPLGTIETRHVVTRHKITRLTHVWRLQAPRTFRAAQGAAQGAENELWVALDPLSASAPVPIGSALKRTMRAVREAFGG